MAQRTVHMLFAEKLSEALALQDKNRFCFGSLLPDAYKDPSFRRKAHFMEQTADGTRKYFDFRRFEKTYREQLLRDDLYLGYYAHLIEDAFYRHYLYYEKDFLNRLPSCQLNVLHQDYHILNAYISGKYSLPFGLELPVAFDREPLNEIAGFDPESLIRDYRSDLTEAPEGKTVLLTEEMLEEFLSEYLEEAENELRAVRSGHSLLNVLDYSWVVK